MISNNRRKRDPKRRRWILRIAIVFGLGALIAGGLIWRASGELVLPARRPILDYHKDWLDRASDHGIRIRHFKAGDIPCLMVEPDAAVKLSKRGEVIRRQLTEQGIELPPFGETIGDLVLLHGRNGRKEDLLPIAERFCAAGFRCLLPDLPAHGESPVQTTGFGSRETEAALPVIVLDEARRQFALPMRPAGLWGMSMGGAFVAAAAAREPARWEALVVVCSFDSLKSVVDRKVSAFTGPLSPIASSLIGALATRRGGVDPATVVPAEWVGTVRVPLLMAHGDQDDLIPSELGRRLFAAYGSKAKRWVDVSGGGHDNVLITDQPLYAEMVAWYLKFLGQSESPDTVRGD